MAFLRRGYVAADARTPLVITVTQLNGSREAIPVDCINCWEEYSLPKCMRLFVVIFVGIDGFWIQETFEEIDALLRGEELNHEN